jgi:6-phosphogluconolactonase
MGGAAGNAGGGAGQAGGGGGPPLTGTPYVFVGSTNGFLRAFSMDATDGSLDAAGELDTGNNLDFIALGPDDRTVFVSRGSILAAYAYDRDAEGFSLLDETGIPGSGTHVAVDPSGRYVFVAHYNQGELSFLSYSEPGGFGTAQLLEPGENAHQTRLDASGAHVYVPCLGSDTVAQYDFNQTSGALTAAATPSAPASGGPRHLDFHPTLPVAYVLTENGSQLHVYDINASTGALQLRTNGSLGTAADAEDHWSSDVHVSPDGRFVYAVNRDPSEIVRFEIDDDGSLTRLGADALGAVVREFAMDPAGRYIQIGGTDGNLVAYRIDPASGALTRTTTQPGLGSIYATLIRYLADQ